MTINCIVWRWWSVLSCISGFRYEVWKICYSIMLMFLFFGHPVTVPVLSFSFIVHLWSLFFATMSLFPSLGWDLGLPRLSDSDYGHFVSDTLFYATSFVILLPVATNLHMRPIGHLVLELSSDAEKVFLRPLLHLLASDMFIHRHRSTTVLLKILAQRVEVLHHILLPLENDSAPK